MGAPAVTYFCRNGHIVEDVPHHCFSQFYMEEEKRVCPTCGTKDIKGVIEWHDPDYWEDGDINAKVPHKPIETDTDPTICPCCGAETYHPTVYDVSKLFNRSK